MAYRIAGIDVHKRDVGRGCGLKWKSRESTSLSGDSLAPAPRNCDELAAWLLEQQVEEVVMESTAQYWKPVWGALERYWQAACRRSGKAPAEVGSAASGAGAVEPRAAGTQERFRRRRTTGEAAGGGRTTLSFVPDSAQRLWRTVMRPSTS